MLPAIVIATGHSDLTLPSIAITIGPLLLWIDHRFGTTRYRLVGWALTVGPIVLALILSGPALDRHQRGSPPARSYSSPRPPGFHDLAEDRVRDLT